ALYSPTRVFSTSFLGSMRLKKAPALLEPPGIISVLPLSMPLMAVSATDSGVMLKRSACLAIFLTLLMPARSIKLVSVGPGHTQDTDMLVSLSSQLNERE